MRGQVKKNTGYYTLNSIRGLEKGYTLTHIFPELLKKKEERGEGNKKHTKMIIKEITSEEWKYKTHYTGFNQKGE